MALMSIGESGRLTVSLRCHDDTGAIEGVDLNITHAGPLSLPSAYILMDPDEAVALYQRLGEVVARIHAMTTQGGPP